MGNTEARQAAIGEYLDEAEVDGPKQQHPYSVATSLRISLVALLLLESSKILSKNPLILMQAVQQYPDKEFEGNVTGQSVSELFVMGMVEDAHRPASSVKLSGGNIYWLQWCHQQLSSTGGRSSVR